MKKAESVLVVSAADKASSEICIFLENCDSFLFSPIVSVSSFADAHTSLEQMHFDIIIINLLPPCEEKGVEFAERVCERYEKSGIILLCGKDRFEAVCGDTEDRGILVLQKPVNKSLIVGGIRLIRAVKKKLCVYEDKTSDLQAKVEEMKLVNRAKSILMAQFKMDESTAHRYIEKQSMDRCIPRSTVAKNIINTYEN